MGISINFVPPTQSSFPSRPNRGLVSPFRYDTRGLPNYPSTNNKYVASVPRSGVGQGMKIPRYWPWSKWAFEPLTIVSYNDEPLVTKFIRKNSRDLQTPAGPSYRLLILSSLSLFVLLVAPGEKDFSGGGLRGNRNNHQPRLPDRERVYIVRASRFDGKHEGGPTRDKHLYFMGLSCYRRGIYSVIAESADGVNVKESHYVGCEYNKKDDRVPLTTKNGRILCNSYQRLLYAAWDFGGGRRSIRLNSSELPAEPVLITGNEYSWEGANATTLTNHLVKRPGVRRKYARNEWSRAVALDTPILPANLPRKSFVRFAFGAGPAAASLSSETYRSVSVLGGQTGVGSSIYRPLIMYTRLRTLLFHGGGFVGKYLATLFREESVGTYSNKGHWGKPSRTCADHPMSMRNTPLDRGESLYFGTDRAYLDQHKSMMPLPPESTLFSCMEMRGYMRATQKKAPHRMRDRLFPIVAAWGNNHLLRRRTGLDKISWINPGRAWVGPYGVEHDKLATREQPATRRDGSGRNPELTYLSPYGWPMGCDAGYQILKIIREKMMFFTRGFKKNVGCPLDTIHVLVTCSSETTRDAVGADYELYGLWDESLVYSSSPNGIKTSDPNRIRTDPFRVRNELSDAEHVYGPLITALITHQGLLYEWLGTEQQYEGNDAFNESCLHVVDTMKSECLASCAGCVEDDLSIYRVGTTHGHGHDSGQPSDILPANTHYPFVRAPLVVADSTGRISTGHLHVCKGLLPREHPMGHQQPSLHELVRYLHSYKLAFEPRTHQTNSPARAGIKEGTGLKADPLFAKIKSMRKGLRLGKPELARSRRPRVRGGFVGSEERQRESAKNPSPHGSIPNGQSRVLEEYMGTHCKNGGNPQLSGGSVGLNCSNSIGEYDSSRLPRVSTRRPPIPRRKEPIGRAEGSLVSRSSSLLRLRGAPLFLVLADPKKHIMVFRAIPPVSPPSVSVSSGSGSFDRATPAGLTRYMRRVRMALDRLQRELAFECPSIDGWNNGYLIIIGVLLSTFVVPVLARGSDCIDLWIRPGIIRFWLYRAGNHNNLGLPRRTNEYRMVGAGRWSMKSFTTNLKHRVRNCGYYFINVIPRTWMGSHEGLDTHSPSELLIRSQFLVTSKKDLRHALVGPHNYFFRDKYRRDDRVQESCYLRYLGGRSYEGMPKKDISHFLKSKTWVLSALWQVITPRNGAPLIPPAASQSGSSLSGGVLSVGSTAETGRSYLTDDLAVDFSATLVSISMGNLCETERYIMMIKSTKMKSNMKLLAFNLCRPITWSKLIEGMSSCIIWIRDMHKLDLRREEEFLGQAEIEIDTEFATRSVSISLDGLTDHAKSTIIVGSTYTPGEMDPSLIRPNRSDRLINVRMLSTPPRRQRRFPSIRPPRGYDPTMIKADGTSTHLNAFGYRVLRHARDLIALTHGVSAVGLCSRSISYRVNAVESIMIGQAIGEHDIYLDTVTNYSGYAYRTGRAVARSPVIGLILLSPSLGFPSCGGEMESPTFTRHTGCMHECEPPYVAGVAGEYAALARASGRLAGSAAHFWAVEESDSISFVRFTECDFAVVRAILDDSMLGEYNWSETHKGRFLAPTGSRFVDRHYSISIGSRLARERRKGGATLRATYNSESGNKYGNAMAIEETTARTHGKGPGKAPNEYWSKAAPDAAKYVPVGPSRAMKDKKTSRPPIHDAVDSITFQGSTWAHQMERDEGGMDGKIIYGPVLLMGKRFIWWHPWAHSEGCPFVGSPHSAKFISYEVGFMPEIGIDESEIVFHSRTADEFTMLMAVICEGNSMLDVAHRGKSIIVNQGSRSELAAGAQNIAAAERTIYGRTAALGTSEHTRLFYPTYMFQGWWLDVDPPTGTVARELPNPQERLGIGSLACGTPIQSVVIESHRYFFKGFSAGVAYPFGN